MLALLSTVVGLGLEPKFHFTVDWASGGVQTTLPIQNFSVRTLRTPFVLTKKKTSHLVLAPFSVGNHTRRGVEHITSGVWRIRFNIPTYADNCAQMMYDVMIHNMKGLQA